MIDGEDLLSRACAGRGGDAVRPPPAELIEREFSGRFVSPKMFDD
jgi:hypothetical protein